MMHHIFFNTIKLMFANTSIYNLFSFILIHKMNKTVINIINYDHFDR